MRCWLTRRDLTALVDGELSVQRAAAVRGHLEHCDACATLHRSIESSVAHQHELLRLATAPGDIAVDRVLRRVTERIADEAEVQRPWFLQPATLAAAAVALIVVAFFGVLEPVFIAVGLQNPPETVAERAEMFRDYALFEYLDAIENFDAVESTPVNRQAPPHG